MTKYEKDEFRSWNKEISKNETQASEKARAIEEKYLKLNGLRSCNPEDFILEIATAKNVKQVEKLTDIRNYVLYLESCAKVRSLGDILHILSIK